MINLKKAFLYLVLLSPVTGCKLDPPVYPNGSATTTMVSGTATYVLNGTTITKSSVDFIITPASANSAASVMITNHNDFAITTNPAGTDAIPGTFLIGNAAGSGTVTFTANTSTDDTHGTFKGSFTGSVFTGTAAAAATAVTGIFYVSQ